MSAKTIHRIVEDECVYIDGHRFIPSVPVRDGRKYTFLVFRRNNEIYSVMGRRYNDFPGRWFDWFMDLREECSLGHIET